MPNNFYGLYCFSCIFFSNLKPPPPHPPHKGSAVFLNIRLSQTCIATAVPPPTWDPYQSSKRKTRRCKIIVGTSLLSPRGEGYPHFTSYVGSSPVSTVHPKINIRNFKHPKKLFEILATQNISPILYLVLKKRPLKCVEMTPKYSPIL